MESPSPRARNRCFIWWKDRALRHDRKCRFMVKTDCFCGLARWRLRFQSSFLSQHILKTLGWSWREISIPQALRASAGGRQGWSAGFSELIAHSSDRSQFRADLARLLQSGSHSEQSNQSWHKHGNAAQRPETMISQLAWWLRTALDAISLLGGFIFVACVEVIRVKRMTEGR